MEYSRIGSAEMPRTSVPIPKEPPSVLLDRITQDISEVDALINRLHDLVCGSVPTKGDSRSEVYPGGLIGFLHQKANEHSILAHECRRKLLHCIEQLGG